jgi:hypothetical protein
MSRQISTGDFRRRISPSALTIHEQKQWALPLPGALDRSIEFSLTMPSARIHKTIAALSPTEFPNLTELRVALAAEAVQAGAAKPSPEVAAHYADRLIATLGVVK